MKVFRNRHHPHIIKCNLVYSHPNCADVDRNCAPRGHVDPSGYIGYGTVGSPDNHWLEASKLEWFRKAVPWFVRHVIWYLDYRYDVALGAVGRETYAKQQYEDAYFLFRRFLLLFGLRF
jgi:hypothetical protein